MADAIPPTATARLRKKRARDRSARAIVKERGRNVLGVDGGEEAVEHSHHRRVALNDLGERTERVGEGEDRVGHVLSHCGRGSARIDRVVEDSKRHQDSQASESTTLIWRLERAEVIDMASLASRMSLWMVCTRY